MNLTLISAFVNKLDLFLQDLINRFPHESDLRKAHNALSITKTQIPREILRKFMKAISPYYIQIFDEDESFFHELNINEQIGGKDDESKQNYISIAKHMRKVWSDDLRKQEKKNIWEHFQVLLTIGAAAYNGQYQHVVFYAEYKENYNLYTAMYEHAVPPLEPGLQKILNEKHAKYENAHFKHLSAQNAYKKAGGIIY